MPKSAWRRRLLYLIRRVGVISAGVVLTALAMQPHALAAHVHGRELDWSMTAPEGWIGGGYYQIETMLQHTGDEVLRDLLKTVQAAAKNKEAALIHLEDAWLAAKRDPSFSTRTLTEIVAVFLRNPIEPTAKTPAEWQQYWQTLADGIATVKHRNSNVRIVSQDSFKVSNQTAFEAVFQVRLPSGGTLYETVIAVPLPSVGRLVFRLEVDSSRHPERRAAMKQMVQSLKIH